MARCRADSGSVIACDTSAGSSHLRSTHAGAGQRLAERGSDVPYQILADYYLVGDTRDRDLWHEYARVSRGLAAVRWSRGLRAAMLGPSVVPEKTDLELAAAWSAVRLAGLDLVLLAAVDNDGESAVQSIMASVGQRLPS